VRGHRQMHHRVIVLGVLALALVSLAGCASRVWNRPLGTVPGTGAYDFRHRMPQGNGDTFVVLAFSGGGTRAAAFSYGVLEKLRDTPVMVDGKSQSMLSQVNVITSVSGGSYTAAYYGLFGDRIFRDFAPHFF